MVDRSLWETVTGAPSSWFDWLLDIFVPQTILASDLCALNLADPALPSVAVLASAFVKDPSSILTLYTYIRDKLRYAAFQSACVCNAAPGSLTCNTAQVNPASCTNFGGASPAQEIGFRFTAIGTSCTGGWLETGTGAGWGSFNCRLWDTTSTGTAMITGTFATGSANTRYAFTWSTAQTLVPGRDYVISFDKANLSIYGAINAGALPSTSQYTGVAQVWIAGTAFPSTTGLGVQPGIEPTVCSAAAPTTPVAPVVDTQPPLLTLPPSWTCTTVADVCTRLLQVDQKLDWLIRSAPLVTNASVALGTVHSGITGTASIAVLGIRGVLVELTTVPAYYGGHGTNPIALYGLGRIDLENALGFFERRQLTETPMLIPVTDPYISGITLNLNAGIVAKVTEVTAGP